MGEAVLRGVLAQAASDNTAAANAARLK